MSGIVGTGTVDPEGPQTLPVSAQFPDQTARHIMGPQKPQGQLHTESGPLLGGIVTQVRLERREARREVNPTPIKPHPTATPRGRGCHT